MRVAKGTLSWLAIATAATLVEMPRPQKYNANADAASQLARSALCRRPIMLRRNTWLKRS